MGPERNIRNLTLIGFMGTGKTTVGHMVAAQLHFDFVDTDHLIEARSGLAISEIFAQQGESAFRVLEGSVIDELARRQGTVFATGGGVGANPTHLASLKTHSLVICLWASAEVICERVQHQTHRPLLQVSAPLEHVRRLLAEREPIYRQADVLINTGSRQLREVAAQVIHQYHTAVGFPA